MGLPTFRVTVRRQLLFFNGLIASNIVIHMQSLGCDSLQFHSSRVHGAICAWIINLCTNSCQTKWMYKNIPELNLNSHGLPSGSEKTELLRGNCGHDYCLTSAPPAWKGRSGGLCGQCWGPGGRSARIWGRDSENSQTICPFKCFWHVNLICSVKTLSQYSWMLTTSH